MTSTAEPEPIRVWLDDSIPGALRAAYKIPEGMVMAISDANADLKLSALGRERNSGVSSRWVYVLAAPFPTVLDGVQYKDIQQQWAGQKPAVFNGQPLLMAASTKAAFEIFWGPAAENAVRVVDEKTLVDSAWKKIPSFVILPFEQLEPRWKVLRVEGISPLDKLFEIETYPLMVEFGWTGKGNANSFVLPHSNRDPSKLTVLVMTGTTALVRSTAFKMMEKGITYPSGYIGGWLREADLTHVSNEAAFAPNCPDPKEKQESLQFCSKPEYIGLLDDVGVDIVELTGNHILNWDVPAFEYTLKLYREHGMKFFGGGENLTEARQPLKIEHNGNQLAFIGCNPAGPAFAWATDKRAGGASCDYDWMKKKISELRQEGYLPIVTLQYPESYNMSPLNPQIRDFNALSNAGAVIVSGSQAHFPQGMAFVNGNFVHYGLGNLFFDQMINPRGLGKELFGDFEKPVAGVRTEFIDRHIFYDGRYLGTELLTAILEDYARPRPMTTLERESFLKMVFEASGW